MEARTLAQLLNLDSINAPTDDDNICQYMCMCRKSRSREDSNTKYGYGCGCFLLTDSDNIYYIFKFGRITTQNNQNCCCIFLDILLI